MKLHRFFIDQSAIRGNEVVFSDKDVISQIKKVLRLKMGDSLIFLDGSGKEYLSAIREISNSGIICDIRDSSENKNEPALKVTLCQALCKKDKFEWVLQKGVEIGVSEFIPVLADRSEKFGLNGERAGKILREAAEQSERGIIPRLGEIVKFEDVLENIPGKKILLDKSGENIKTLNFSLSISSLVVFVGPEGGWTDSELEAAKKHGAEIVSIGSTVLRTETAGLAASAILLNR